MSLLLAEDGYATRFRYEHAVVPNTTAVPQTVEPPGTERVVYLGTVTRARGALEMIELGRLLRGEVVVELIGPAVGDATEDVRRAHEAGDVVAHGFVPNDEAVRLLDGALVGLSLLHDEANYRHSRPTKIIEYMAHGVPVITTPLPVAVEIVESAGSGVVVPFGDVDDVVAQIRELRADDARRSALGQAGHAAALERYDWHTQGPLFVAALEAAARRR
jgi:glycosyltransferase involved in cell wall biosynthesis